MEKHNKLTNGRYRIRNKHHIEKGKIMINFEGNLVQILSVTIKKNVSMYRIYFIISMKAVY